MNRGERSILMILPWASLLAAGATFTFLFPTFTDVQGWIISGMDAISFPIWFLCGGIMGAAISAIWTRWPKRLPSILRRAVLILLGYIGIAIVIALIIGEGEGLERIGDSGPVKVWGFAIWTLAAMGPSMMGTIAILRGSKWARGGAALSFVALSTSVMTYSQASRAEITSQDPLLAILFIWSIILFVEGLNWKKRYLDPDDEVVEGLWIRQASFTIMYLGLGSVIAYIPFLFSGDILSSYEAETILGKAIIGAIILMPLGIIAVVKGYLDQRKKT